MGKKLLEPIQVGGMTLKNRIMFPPLTTGYEERDGSIGPRSLSFYERLAKGGTAYIVIGDVAPVRTASPTPMLYEDSQIPAFQKLADALHVHGSKLALQIFHPEYDVQGVGRLIMGANMVRKAAADAQAAGNEEECQKQTALAEKTTKEAIAFAKLLEEAGVDMIQVAQANHTGNMGDTIPPMGDVSYNWTLPTAKKVKAVVSIPVATVGRVVTTEAGERILEQGEADVIGYGRSLLTDPDIAVKTAAGECIRECLNCNKGCVDAIQNRRYISCILNAENGDEATIFLKEAADPKKVAVVGAGIAGLEAARVAAKRGHQVTLFEKGDKIGGQIHLAAVPPRKSEILRAITYYEKILPTLSIELKLHTQPTAQELNDFDTVIVAVGAHNMPLPMKAENSNVCSAWEILAGAEASGVCAVLGGGLVGTETAEYLASRGHKVVIIEMLDKIASGESATVLPLILKDFEAHGVEQHVNTKVKEIRDNVIYAENTQEGTECTIHADTIVNALGSKKNVWDGKEITVPLTLIGDCAGERTADIAAAIRSGYHAANEI